MNVKFRLRNVTQIICRHGFGQAGSTRIPRGSNVAREDMWKEENVLEPFPWHGRNKMPKQFWKLGSCLFTDTNNITSHFLINVLQQRHIILGCGWHFLINISYYYHYIFIACDDGQISSSVDTYTITRALGHSSFCLVNFTLVVRRPYFAKSLRTTYKSAKAWWRVTCEMVHTSTL